MQTLSLGYWGLTAAALVAYFRLPRVGQNVLLLAASITVCAGFGFRCVVLLIASTVLDYAIGRRLEWSRPESSRLRWTWFSVVSNVGLLALAKYGRLLSGQPSSLLGHALGEELRSWSTLGLSFYTLARMTHTLDVYYRIIRPARSLLDFSLFVAFFPQLTAGPIERARNILPQLAKRRRFELTRLYEATWLIGLGLFKKVFVADHCALLVKRLLGPGTAHNGLELLLGTYAFAFQLYGDFAGYSDMARGTARLFGIEIMQNFEAPYLGLNLAEYWRRWHISLSSFLEDYVHRPAVMTLRAHGTVGVVIAIWVTFLLSGLWHGTGWTFVAWGALHAAGLSAFALSRKLRKQLKQRLPSQLWTALSWLLTFHFVCFGYVLFRAPSLASVATTLSDAAAGFAVTLNVGRTWSAVLFYAACLLSLDVMQRRQRDAFWIFAQRPWVRTLCYAVLLLCVVRLFAPGDAFIYAEF
ncbi:MAG TPA: MBOAT family O-acyltransferase [Polyangiales bacterium]